MSTPYVIQLCRRALADSSVADPALAVQAVVDALPDDALRDALQDALTVLAPTLASTERRTLRAGRSASTSPRWERAAAGHNLLLRMRLATEHGHIFLGDATVADLRHQEAVRRRHAAATTAQADWFANAWKAMTEHGAERFADLPADVIGQLGEAA